MKHPHLKFISIIGGACFSAPLAAMAQTSATVTINPSIPFVSGNASLPGLIQGFYLFALSLAGVLAFGAIVYGGIKYAAGRGNPSSESEGKSWITNALLGLLLLGGAYVILQTVNPALTSLTLPGLPHLNAAPLAGFNAPVGTTTYGLCYYPNNGLAPTFFGTYSSDQACVSASAAYATLNGQFNCVAGASNATGCGGKSATTPYSCVPTSSGEGTYNGPGAAGSPSSWSSGLSKVMGCVQPAIAGFGGTAPWTTNGQHVCNLTVTPPSISCHFGGSCTDGGHAFDIDVPNNSLSLLQQAKSAALQCGNTTGQQVSCRCESQNGAQLDPGCTQSYDNHVHCNVDVGSCGCN